MSLNKLNNPTSGRVLNPSGSGRVLNWYSQGSVMRNGERRKVLKVKVMVKVSPTPGYLELCTVFTSFTASLSHRRGLLEVSPHQTRDLAP